MSPWTYVALGDSMSIDVYAGGPGRGPASLLLRNVDADFPEWAGRDLTTTRPGAALQLLATDGATCAGLVERQLPRLHALRTVPSLITLTIGGNDLLQAYGETPAARQVVRQVREDVHGVLTVVRSLAGPTTHVIVSTVYDPSDGTGNAAALGLPPWPEGVAMIALLNEALVEVAAEHAALVADVHGRFLGHGVLAGDPSQASPRPANRDLWYCNVIEPNAWGASAIRAAFWDALAGVTGQTA